jgi:cation transport ATPase
MLSHKHIPYGMINTSMKDAETLTEPLLDEEVADVDAYANIPPLNPEDPLSGLTDEQVKQSLETFGKNEVSIDQVVGIIGYCCMQPHLLTSCVHALHAHF